MEAFTALRQQARDKRDKAISLARSDYEATMRRIAALEQDLPGTEPSTRQTVSNCINRVLPSDRPFTTSDVLDGLIALDASRDWRARVVHRHMTRLRASGVIRRLHKVSGREQPVYVRNGVQTDAGPFEDKTLAEVVCEVLAGKSLNLTELTVAIMDAGYKSLMTPRDLRHAIGEILRDGVDQFAQSGAKWRMV